MRTGYDGLDEIAAWLGRQFRVALQHAFQVSRGPLPVVPVQCGVIDLSIWMCMGKIRLLLITMEGDGIPDSTEGSFTRRALHDSSSEF